MAITTAITRDRDYLVLFFRGDALNVLVQMRERRVRDENTVRVRNGGGWRGLEESL